MKLKDIGDMETYLAERCYCPNEIYDASGIFYNMFYPENDCVFIGSHRRDGATYVYVISNDEHDNAQILFVALTGGFVDDCMRLPYNENNVEQFKKLCSGEICSATLSGYDDKKSLSEVLAMADLIMVS